MANMHWIWLYKKSALTGPAPEELASGQVERLMERCLQNDNLAIAFEIASLNRHRLLNRSSEVLDALQAKHRPFVFVLGKN
jgi:hypothetical protein